MAEQIKQPLLSDENTTNQQEDKPILVEEEEDDVKQAQTLHDSKSKPQLTDQNAGAESSSLPNDPFNHGDSDSDDDVIDEDISIAARSAVIITKIMSRHYGLLFALTVFGASLGFIIYLFTSYAGWVYVLALAGLGIGIILDYQLFGGQKEIEIMTKYTQSEEEMELCNRRWEKEADQKDTDFHVQSDFYSRYENKYRGSSRVYHKKDSGALVFEKKSFKRVQNYCGFEIGGGISSFIGFVMSLTATLLTDIGIGGGILLVFFMIIIFGLMGCICERELRKWQFIPPINCVLVKRDSIALHDISHVCVITYGYHLDHAGISSESVIEKMAIAWFKLNAGVFYTIYMIVVFLCYVFWVNSAFTLWLFVTASLFMIFPVQLNKDNETLNAAMWTIIASTLLAIMCAIFVSPYYRKPVKIGNVVIEQVDYKKRLDRDKQKKLYIVFLICAFGLLISSVFVTYVAAQISDIGQEYFNDDQYNANVWNAMVCKEERDTAFPFGEDAHRRVLQDESPATTLCKDLEYEFMAVSILLLCIIWYLLLATAFWWNHFDKYQFSMEGKIRKGYTRKWHQYSYMYVYRKSEPNSSSFFGLFSNTYTIELQDKDALKLQLFLNEHATWYSKAKFVGINSRSLEFVQAFDTVKVN